MRILGIDPGFDGGLATIGERSTITMKIMPTIGEKKRTLNLQEIIDFIRPGCIFVDLAVIEKVHSMPKQGVASSFAFGLSYGQLQGICAALKLPFVLVTPQQWKKVILVGYNWKVGKGASEKEKKAAAVQYVQQKYPNLDLRKNLRCRNPHYGVVDAICLAEYGLSLQHNGGKQ